MADGVILPQLDTKRSEQIDKGELREGWETLLKDETRRGYLRDNALKVFLFD